MFNLLRSTLKHSCKHFGMNSLKLTDVVLISRNVPYMNQLVNNCFHVTVPYLSREVMDSNIISKLNENARRKTQFSLEEIEDIFEGIKSIESATGAECLMVMRCCGNLISMETPQKRSQLVQKIWNGFEKLNVNFDISLYNALLKAYLENEHPFVPTEILVELEQRGIEPNQVTYQNFIIRYCQMGDVEGATRTLQLMREKNMPINDINVFNALVLGFSMVDDMDSAEGILNDMRKAGYKPTAETYALLIHGYAIQGSFDKALAVKGCDIDKIISKVECTIVCNQKVISRVTKLAEIKKMKMAVEKLKEEKTRLESIPGFRIIQQ